MDERLEPLFPRDIYGRMALTLASLTFGPIFWLLAVVVVFGARPGPQVVGWPEWCFLAVVGELSVALALFFACGLVWAIATPRWLEQVLDVVVTKLMMALGLFVLPFLGLCVWAVILG
jgi:hypothetical protein